MVDFQDNTSADQDEVYLNYGTLPTRSEYDYRDSNLAAANQQVTVPSAAPGTWYILVYADLYQVRKIRALLFQGLWRLGKIDWASESHQELAGA